MYLAPERWSRRETAIQLKIRMQHTVGGLPVPAGFCLSGVSITGHLHENPYGLANAQIFSLEI